MKKTALGTELGSSKEGKSCTNLSGGTLKVVSEAKNEAMRTHAHTHDSNAD